MAEAVETLLSLEKQTRTAADMHSTAKILVAIVKICFEAKDYTALNENIILLTKRRGQLKQVCIVSQETSISGLLFKVASMLCLDNDTLSYHQPTKLDTKFNTM